MKNILVIVVLVSTAIGCGSSTDPPDKDLFSRWIRVDHMFTFDICGYNFGRIGVPFTHASGSVCANIINLVGDQKSGHLTIMQTYYIPGAGYGLDPGYNSLPKILSYKINGDKLNLCDAMVVLITSMEGGIREPAGLGVLVLPLTLASV